MPEFEHALFMLLLLVGLLNAKPALKNLIPLFVGGGMLLALLPPIVRIPLPWDLILALTIPLLFWQNARRWLDIRWKVGWRELFLWAITATILMSLLALTGYLSWTGALLFGITAASMLWSAFEPGGDSSEISQLGPLTLVFLLTEIAPAVETPNRYLGGLFSGAALGIGVAWLAVIISLRFLPRQRGWLAIGQVYLAYWLATAVDASGVAAALISIGFYVEFGLRRGLDQESLLLPAPFNNWPVLLILLVAFVLLGWQVHQPLTSVLLLEAGLGFVIGWLVAWIGRRLGISGFAGLGSLWRAGLRTSLYLFTALLLWPRNVLLEPLPLAIALGLAVLLMVVSTSLLSAAQIFQESA